MARWLAAQAEPSGQVVATDSDPRFLADTDKAGVEVRRHDILADPPAPGRYDLVHCRALLYHLADPRQAVRNMAAAVRPGGWLLIQDADYVSLVAAEPAHLRAASSPRLAWPKPDPKRLPATGGAAAERPSCYAAHWNGCTRWS